MWILKAIRIPDKTAVESSIVISLSINIHACLNEEANATKEDVEVWCYNLEIEDSHTYYASEDEVLEPEAYVKNLSRKEIF